LVPRLKQGNHKGFPLHLKPENRKQKIQKGISKKVQLEQEYAPSKNKQKDEEDIMKAYSF